MPDSETSEETIEPGGRTQRGRIGDVPDTIRRRYYTDDRGGPGQGFYVDATVKRPAFRDSGNRLVLDRADPNAIRDAAEIARHRGWLTVQVKGSEEFRREAWLVALQLGLEVQGYRATERDLQELDRRLEQRARSEVRRELHLARDDDRPSRSQVRQANRASRRDEPAASQMRTVEAVVRSRVQDTDRQQRILDAARSRIADWLERGAQFPPSRPARTAPERQRGR
jgi:hypothetical protein